MRGSYAALVVLALCVPGESFAGAWTSPPGIGFARLGVSRFHGADRLLSGPFVTAAPELVASSVELYAEIGLFSRLELALSIRGVEHAHHLDDGRVLSSAGLGDAELLFEAGLLGRGQSALALVAGVRASPYRSPSEAELAAGTPRLGPGGGDLLIGGSWGRVFGAGWIGAEVLSRIRLPGASSGLLLRTELGHVLLQPITGAIFLELMPAFGRDGHRMASDPAPVPRVLALGTKLFVELWSGFGMLGEVSWQPEVFNDGPGLRFALSATWRS